MLINTKTFFISIAYLHIGEVPNPACVFDYIMEKVKEGCIIRLVFHNFIRNLLFLSIKRKVLTSYVFLYTGMNSEGNLLTQSYQATKLLGGLGYEVGM